MVCRQIAEEDRAKEAANVAAALARAAAAAAAAPPTASEPPAAAPPRLTQGPTSMQLPEALPQQGGGAPQAKSQAQAPAAHLHQGSLPAGQAGHQSVHSGGPSMPPSIAGAMQGPSLAMPGLTFSTQAPATSTPSSAHAAKQGAVHLLKSAMNQH